jgi:alkane 1-monooxygenase
MNRYRFLKYLPIYTVPLAAYIALTGSGWWTYALVIYAFGIVPLLDALFPIDDKNLSQVEEEIVKTDRIYDYLLYSTIPIQYALLVLFLFAVQRPDLSNFELAGMILSFGICCGGIGINVAHELGHRTKTSEQNMSKALLLTSLYMHFFIEHNRGHHKNVSTPNDPASSQRNELLYTFWIRSVVGSYLSAWHLEHERLQKQGLSIISLHNEMIRFSIIQLAFLGAIAWAFGVMAMLYFVVSAVIGFLLLETINYVEHYGLSRKKTDRGTYEQVMPVHSWNSDYVVGRVLLFELTRHSDHHYRASRKYQVLRHFANAPQMPLGYPGMILLSLFPPAWFYVMNRRIDNYKAQFDTEHALA